MSLLDDINQARNTVQERAGNLAFGITQQGPRYSYDNADQQDSWEGRFLGADRERLRHLDLLSNAIQQPEWTSDLDKDVEARRTAGNLQADAGFRQAESQRRVAAARSGTAAGSNDAAVEEDNRQRVAMAKAQVSQQVSELRAAGIQNLEEMGRQLLSKALAGPEESGAMGVQSESDGNRRNTSNLMSQNDGMYRDLLANTMAGFLTNTVTPAVAGGFQAADRWNQQQRDNYLDARDAGSYTGTFNQWAEPRGGTRSWW